MVVVTAVVRRDGDGDWRQAVVEQEDEEKGENEDERRSKLRRRRNRIMAGKSRGVSEDSCNTCVVAFPREHSRYEKALASY